MWGQAVIRCKPKHKYKLLFNDELLVITFWSSRNDEQNPVIGQDMIPVGISIRAR